jgi:hypothetical protein
MRCIRLDSCRMEAGPVLPYSLRMRTKAGGDRRYSGIRLDHEYECDGENIPDPGYVCLTAGKRMSDMHAIGL